MNGIGIEVTRQRRTTQRIQHQKAMAAIPHTMTGVSWSVWNWLAKTKRYSNEYHLRKIDRELTIEFRKVLKELDLLEK
jgi:hypothetical protein